MRRYLSSSLLTRDDRFPMVLPEASNKDSEMEKNDFPYSMAHLGVCGASSVGDDRSHLLH